MRETSRVSSLFIILLTSLLLGACIPDDDDDEANLGLSITFTNPAGVDKIETADIVVNITGTVTSGSEVDVVEWRNDRGGKGKANGKTNWVTGNIVLQPGVNTIEVTAHTIGGESTSKIIKVERGPAQAGATNDADGNITTLSWLAPTTRDDQSTLSNLAGYYVYYGQRSGDYLSKIPIPDPDMTSHVVRDLSPGTWYFAISAYDDNGLESLPSSEISRTL